MVPCQLPSTPTPPSYQIFLQMEVWARAGLCGKARCQRAAGAPETPEASPEWGSPPPLTSEQGNRCAGPRRLPWLQPPGQTWNQGAPHSLSQGGAWKTAGWGTVRGTGRGRCCPVGGWVFTLPLVQSRRGKSAFHSSPPGRKTPKGIFLEDLRPQCKHLKVKHSP